MVASDTLAEFLREQLAPLGRVTMRRMFGKTGVFCDGVMLGMVTENTLYFRVDDQNRKIFKEARSFPPSTIGRKAAPSTSRFGARRSGCSTSPANSSRGHEQRWPQHTGLRRSGTERRQSENRSLDQSDGEGPLLLLGDRASDWPSWLLYDPPEPCIVIVQKTA
jgi:hypothetical protein